MIFIKVHRIKWKKLSYIKNDGTKIDFDRYIISNNGKIFDLYKNKEVKQLSSSLGYNRAWLIYNDTGDTYYAHRLVASTFIAYPGGTKLTVNHIDGNKLNNKYYNLEWISISENVKHAIRNELTPTIGEKTRLMSDDIVNEICIYLSKGMQIPDIANIIKKKYSIDRPIDNIKTNISDILSGRAYVSISSKYDFSSYTSTYRLPLELITYICEELQNKVPQIKIINNTKNIWSKYNRTKSSMQTIVSYIYKKKMYTDISKKYVF